MSKWDWRVVLFLVFSFVACNSGGGSSGDDLGDNGGEGSFAVEEVLTGIQFPGSLVFSPDGRLFFSEIRTGVVRFLREGELEPRPFVQVAVPVDNFGGTFGLAFDRNFSRNRFVYLFYTDRQTRLNRVVRFKEQGGVAEDATVIIAGIPAGGHDGGKLATSSDGTLFISVGDAGNPALAQEMGSLGGKILRIDNDGGIPADNPFPDSPVYALGFRNVFGVGLHPRSETLYVSDNGPDCDDEVNLVLAGRNYGWRPEQPCSDTASGYEPPIYTLAQSSGVTGVAFYEGDKFSGLNGELLLADYNTGSIRRLAVDDGGGSAIDQGRILSGEYGPVIDLTSGPDGYIYFCTQDAIYRIVPN